MKIYFSRFIIALIAAFFCLFGTKGQSLNWYLKAARVQKQQPDSALIYLDSALRPDPVVPIYLTRKAEILLSLKRYKEAAKIYESLQNSAPATAALGLTRALAAQGKATPALNNLSLYLKTDAPLPENKIRFDSYLKTIEDSATWQEYWKTDHYQPDQQMAKECLFMAQSGQEMEALDKLNLRLKKSRSPELWHARAVIYRNMKMLNPADADYRNAISRQPRNVEWLSEYVSLLFEISNYEDVVRFSRQALTVEPAIFELYLLRAKAFAKLKKRQEAMADVDLYLRYFSDIAEAYAVKAEVNIESNTLLPALIALNKALELKPGNCNYLLMRVKVFVGTSMPQRAINDLEKVLECYPERGDIWFMRGELYAQTGNKEKACQDWKRAASLGYLEAFKRTEHVCNSNVPQ
jgi:tetratricopeptide (TPR) repeat protein